MADVKQLIIKKHSRFPNSLVISYEGGGQVPAELSGQYTTYEQARVAIQQYVLRPSKKSGKLGGK